MNCWVNIQAKLSYYTELIKWSARKKRMSQQELKDKQTTLFVLLNQQNPNMMAIKQIEEELAFWMEQEDIKWNQMAK